MTKYYSLNDNIVLRKEYFGGIIFNKNTGTIIDLDQEAFLLLKYIDKNNYLNKEEIMYLISKSSRDFKV
ncbi:MAG: hypothetical protein ACQEQF_12620, partial [Bacillota bacterium]